MPEPQNRTERTNTPQLLQPKAGSFGQRPTPLSQRTVAVPRRSVFTVSRANAPIRRNDGTPMTPVAPLPAASKKHAFDLALQRSVVASERAQNRQVQLSQWADEAKIAPRSGRCFLRMLVAEAYEWRRQEYHQSLTSRTLASSALPFHLRLKPRQETPTLNVFANEADLFGILDDIDAILMKPDVLETNDSKNMYSKILANLAQLGLFRPIPPPQPSAAATTLAPDY